MLRWVALACATGLALSPTACALDVRGLGTGVATDAGGGVPGPAGDGAEAGSAGGGGPEAAVDAPASADAAAEAAPSCDQDGDGHAAAGPPCGGDDCCDQDGHVHPGQTTFFASAGACGGYDFDCDGKESPQYPGVACQWSAFACSGDGFAAPLPACGAFGTFTSCNVPWYDVLSCAGSDAQQVQPCR